MSVKVGDEYSELKYILSGVPQGSVLEPLHKDDVETCVGVVYRSPNSNHSEFLEIYKTIKQKIHILGDFNTNLFKHNDPNTKNFEDHFLIEKFSSVWYS